MAFWVADFTYCSTWSRIVYVASIIDAYFRRLVGRKTARSMTTPLSVRPNRGHANASDDGRRTG
jgi:transposase InsO family protein